MVEMTAAIHIAAGLRLAIRAESHIVSRVNTVRKTIYELDNGSHPVRSHEFGFTTLYYIVQTAIWICYSVSARAISIPGTQQIRQNNVSPSNLLPAAQVCSVLSNVDVTRAKTPASSSSNPILPPPIPGFEVRLLFDRKPTLVLWEIYDMIIQLISILALESWEQLLGHVTGLLDPNYKETLIISPWPDVSSGLLLIKHAVVALYEAGFALAAKPATVPGYAPRLYAGLFLQDQQLGFLKWLHKPASVGGGMNSTLGTVDASNSSSTPQFGHSDERNGVGARSRTIVDPRDRKLQITYRLGSQRANLTELFSALLEGLAAAAPNDASGFGAFVTALDTSRNITVNIHGSGIPSLLSWGHLIDSLLLIWGYVIKANHLVEMDFEVFYDGVKIGEGDILKIDASGASLVSS